jgi:cardiolipin synthase
MSRGRRRKAKRRASLLRRHGLVPRPKAIAAIVADPDLRFSEGNRITIYDTGRAGLDAMLAAVEGAKRRVHLETYILRADATGRAFLAALERHARAGREVRLLYDSIGSFGLDESALQPLREAGGQVVAFNPLTRFWPRFAPRQRDHRKILIVDGEVAFTGGLNIGDEYVSGLGGSDVPGAWRDAHARVEGPCVRDLEAVFLESWFRADGPDVPWDAVLAPPRSGVGPVRCAVLADGPSYRRRRTREILSSALAEAEREVRLISPYFAPGRRLLERLGDASARGVHVTLLLAGHASDHGSLRRAAHAVLPKLLERGVRVYEYDAEMMHAKVACFDEDYAIVGSSNLDRQSFEHGYEVNLVIDDAGVAKTVRDRFDAYVSRARRVDLETLAQRGIGERLLDWLAAQLLRWI